MNIPFSYFPRFVLRTPYFPVNFLNPIIKKNVSLKKTEEICRLPEVQEAIFLASPNLFNKMNQWLNGTIIDKKEIKRTICSLIKYIVRMASRTTKFGLFSGVSTGIINEKTVLETCEIKDYGRHTRLDMNFLCSLSADLMKDEIIRKQLNYFPNSSLYNIGDRIRYVEYRYKKAQRTHHVIEVEKLEHLEKVLANSKKGIPYSGLVNLILNDDISQKESEDFIDELILSQILVSELDPNVTGTEYLQRIISILSGIKKCRRTKEKLLGISKLISDIDKNSIGTTLKKYQVIKNELKFFETEYDNKYLFQSDMKKKFIKCTISDKIVEDILGGISFLKKISKKYINNDLKKFKEDYFLRYEQREMPLSKVLDVETGIGYGINVNNSGDISPLIDDIGLSFRSENSELKWDRIDSVLFRKYLNSIKSSLYSVSLSDEDFEDFKIDDKNLPDTFSVMVEIMEDDKGDEKIYIKSVGGASAVNLLGRFCFIDDNIRRIVEDIIKKEESVEPDKIFAEIVHLPQARTGNILLRPTIRKYEIPYLSNSSVPLDNQININDLYVSLSENKIVLRSKKLNKEVVPKLGTAHNYSNNSLPIYKFLCDLQTQNMTGGFGFTWGPLSGEYEFLPRVNYKNIILSPAAWNLKIKDYLEFINKKESEGLLPGIKKWREEKKIPSLILLADGDNKLLFNLENEINVEIFHSLIKNRSYIKLEEYLYKSFSPVVSNDRGKFISEFIFSFFRIS